MVVDDELPVSVALRRMLVAEHDVTTFNRAKDALVCLLEGTRFDVILCDLMMPDVTGVDLYKELSAVAPEQAEKMIFITGGEFSQAARDFLDSVPNHRIEKPFDIQSLRAVVRDQIR